MSNKIFNKFVVVALTISLLSCARVDKNIDFYCYDNGVCTPYCEGIVYIGDKDFLDKIEDDVNSKDILVEDLRYSFDNPDMKIRNSCYIKDLDIQNEIIGILCEYEKCYPSRWNRSLDSMKFEWFMHNLAYDLGFLKSNSRDVDFDNEDEEEYGLELIKVLKV